MKYHINYEGKVMPCRAVVKECPYGGDRHAENPQDLYMKFQDTYTEDQTPPYLRRDLQKGKIFSSVSLINDEIAKSNSPLETICSTLKTAYKNAGKGNISEQDKSTWEEAIYKTKTLLEIGKEPPKRTPSDILEEAEARVTSSPLRALFKQHDDTMAARGSWNYLVDNTAELTRIDRERHAHQQITEDQKIKYKQDLFQVYSQYAEALNTRKLVSTPFIRYENTSELIHSLDSMSNEELQSLYDDCTIDDEEIQKRIKRCNYFDYIPNPNISDEANANIAKWYEKAQLSARLYMVGRAQRVLISMSAADVLRKRGAFFGDKNDLDL